MKAVIFATGLVKKKRKYRNALSHLNTCVMSWQRTHGIINALALARLQNLLQLKQIRPLQPAKTL